MAKITRAEVASVLRASKKGIVVDLEVSASAFRAGLSSINPWRKRLGISVKAKPKKGEANKEIIELLAETFDVSTNDITILSGHTSSQKRVEVIGITLDAATAIILKALSGGSA